MVATTTGASSALVAVAAGVKTAVAPATGGSVCAGGSPLPRTHGAGGAAAGGDGGWPAAGGATGACARKAAGAPK